jgi:outer membrane protein assembly factor BamB
MLRRTLQALICLSVTLSLSTLRGEEWTQFRGSDYGRTAESKVAKSWDSNTIEWRTPLPGPGSSSPAVFGDRVYLTSYTGYGIDNAAPGNPADLVRHLVCIDAPTGKIVWQKSVPAESDKNDYNVWGVGVHGYASSTPSVDETGIYICYGATGVLAYDHEGNLRWKTNVGGGTHAFGTGNSAVLYKDLVIVNASVESGDLIALKKSDGSEVWRQGGIERSWNTPVVYKSLNGRTELAVTIEGKILAFDPDTGTPLWSCAGIDDYICPQIIVEDGILYASGGRRSEMIAIRSGGNGDVTDSHQIWEIAKGSNVSSPVFYDGHLYWAKETRGIVYCANAKTGELVYEERLDPLPERIYASPLLADGRLYYVSRKAGIYVIAAQPEYELLAHTKIDDDDSVFNASPVPLPGGAVLLRSDKYLYRMKPAQ